MTILHQTVSELTLLEHLSAIVLVIRNLSFVRANQHFIVKCFKVVEIVASLFVDRAEAELTSNCLDILTNVGKLLVLSDLPNARELVAALYDLFSSSDQEPIVD